MPQLSLQQSELVTQLPPTAVQQTGKPPRLVQTSRQQSLLVVQAEPLGTQLPLVAPLLLPPVEPLLLEPVLALPLLELLLGTQMPKSLDSRWQLVPPGQPVLAFGSQTGRQVPSSIIVVDVPVELQNQPVAQRSAAAQTMLFEQVEVKSAMLPLWRQKPKAAAPPSPEAS